MSTRELTRDAFNELPLRSMVALAARAARRVQPLFNDWNDVSGTDAHAAAVEAAIVYAESFARETETPHELAGEGGRLENAADKAAKAASDNNAFGQGNAAVTAAYAARATINATDSFYGTSPGEKRQLAEAAARVAWDALQHMLMAYSTEAERREALDDIEAAYTSLVARKLGHFPGIGEPAQLD